MAVLVKQTPIRKTIEAGGGYDLVMNSFDISAFEPSIVYKTTFNIHRITLLSAPIFRFILNVQRCQSFWRVRVTSGSP